MIMNTKLFWMLIILVVSLTIFPAGVAQADTLVGYWDFDNSTDVGEGYVGDDLKAFGNASYNAGGKYNGAVGLDGDGDFLALDDGFGGEDTTRLPGDLPTGDESYSISAWIKLAADPDRRGIVKWGGAGSGKLNLFRTYDEVEEGMVDEGLLSGGWGGPSYDYHAAAGDVDDGAWHHAVSSYNSTTSTKRLYFDGSEIGSGSVISDLNVQANNFVVGRGFSSDEYFNGLIDDLAIFDYALSDSQISGLNNGTLTPLTVPEPSTLVLLGMGALALLFVMRRRRR